MGRRQWIPVILMSVFAVVCGFNACGPAGFHGFEDPTATDLSSITGDTCTIAEKEVYAQTYFPLLSVSCNKCHSDAHGSTDINTSWAGFEQYGKTLIDYQATHPHEGNGIDLTNQLATIQTAYSAGQTAYAACLTATGASNGDFLTSNKAMTGLTVANANNSVFKTFTWDLDVDVPAAQQNKIHAILSADVMYSMYVGAIAGLQVKNITLKNKTTGTTTVGPMHLYLDGQLYSGMTAYSTLSAQISSMTATALMSGAGSSVIADAAASPTTTIGFDFASIAFVASAATPTPTPIPAGTIVTYNFLMSTDSNAVIQRTCVGCHNAYGTAVPAGGLDFTQYSVAKANASAIYAAISGTGFTMPKTGTQAAPTAATTQLSAARIALIKNWVDNGAPLN